MADDDEKIPLHDGEPLTDEQAHELSEKLLHRLAQTGGQEESGPADVPESD